MHGGTAHQGGAATNAARAGASPRCRTPQYLKPGLSLRPTHLVAERFQLQANQPPTTQQYVGGAGAAAAPLAHYPAAFDHG
jgi:hypothetical protein